MATLNAWHIKLVISLVFRVTNFILSGVLIIFGWDGTQASMDKIIQIIICCLANMLLVHIFCSTNILQQGSLSRLFVDI